MIFFLYKKKDVFRVMRIIYLGHSLHELSNIFFFSKIGKIF